MEVSFVSPDTCGFAKVAALSASNAARLSVKREKGESSNKLKARIMEERHRVFLATFEQNKESFNVSFQSFNKRFPLLQSHMNNWNRRKNDEKKDYLEKFSVANWKELLTNKKREHSISKCKGCFAHYPEVQAHFPVFSRRLKAKAAQNPFSICNDLRKNTPQPNKSEIKNAAALLYKKTSPVFEKWSGGTTLGEALTKVCAANVEQKKSAKEKKNIRRKILRETKENVEKQWEENSLLR